MPWKDFKHPFNKPKKKLTIHQKVAVTVIIISAYSIPTLFGRFPFFMFAAVLFFTGVILDLLTEETSKLSSLKEVLWWSLVLGTVAFFILLAAYYLFILIGVIGR